MGDGDGHGGLCAGGTGQRDHGAAGGNACRDKEINLRRRGVVDTGWLRVSAGIGDGNGDARERGWERGGRGYGSGSGEIGAKDHGVTAGGDLRGVVRTGVGNRGDIRQAWVDGEELQDGGGGGVIGIARLGGLDLTCTLREKRYHARGHGADAGG